MILTFLAIGDQILILIQKVTIEALSYQLSNENTGIDLKKTA